MVIGFTLKSDAQQGVTKFGTNALANNSPIGDYNTGLGFSVLAANTTGNRNTGAGANALRFNTVGVYNTATGAAALYQNTIGKNNSGFGAYALFTNTSGYQNTALGNEALRLNTTGISNTAVGHVSMYTNTSGMFNTSNGSYSMYYNTTGYSNTATGYSSLFNNTIGRENTAAGYRSLYTNTSGNTNTATGYNSLYSNTSGSGNTAIGYGSLYDNTTGTDNAAIGRSALLNNTTGYNNIGIGYNSLQNNTTGYDNTAIGVYALFQNSTGSRNTALGREASPLDGNLTNTTAIGYSASITASNRVRIGNTFVTSIGGQVGWSNFSDGRYKKDIKENVPGLAFINNLRPITYTVNVKGLNEFYNKLRAARGINLPYTEDKAAKAEMEKSEEAAAKIIYNGFVAQEVESAARKINFEFSGVDKPENKDDLYGLRYDNFISPLVKAVQELSKKNDEKDSLISDFQVIVNDLQSLTSDLQNQIDDLKSLITKSGNGGAISSSAGYLIQNSPNPSRSNTVISYFVPDNAGQAQIRITDVNGRVIKTFNAAKGEGRINIRSGELSAGTYSYTLFVNNRTVDTKQMVLVGNSR